MWTSQEMRVVREREPGEPARYEAVGGTTIALSEAKRETFDLSYGAHFSPPPCLAVLGFLRILIPSSVGLRADLMALTAAVAVGSATAAVSPRTTSLWVSSNARFVRAAW